jgi:peptide/nickel transport system permease protein
MSEMTIKAIDGGEDKTPAPPEREKVSQSYWNLVWYKFRKNKLAIVGAVIILLFYLMCLLFPEFFAPYGPARESNFIEAPPTWPHFVDEEGNFSLRPFVYGYTEEIDQALRKRIYTIDTTQKYPMRFFVRGDEYKLLGLIPMSIHLYGVDHENADANIFVPCIRKLVIFKYTR